MKTVILIIDVEEPPLTMTVLTKWEQMTLTIARLQLFVDILLMRGICDGHDLRSFFDFCTLATNRLLFSRGTHGEAVLHLNFFLASQSTAMFFTFSFKLHDVEFLPRSLTCHVGSLIPSFIDSHGCL